MLQLELRIAVDRNAKLEADLKSEQQQLAEMQAALESMSTKLQHVRQQNALQTQELQQATADKLQEAVGRANKMQQELTEQTLQCEQTAAQLKYAQEQLKNALMRASIIGQLTPEQSAALEAAAHAGEKLAKLATRLARRRCRGRRQERVGAFGLEEQAVP